MYLLFHSISKHTISYRNLERGRSGELPGSSPGRMKYSYFTRRSTGSSELWSLHHPFICLLETASSWMLRPCLELIRELSQTFLVIRCSGKPSAFFEKFSDLSEAIALETVRGGLRWGSLTQTSPPWKIWVGRHWLYYTGQVCTDRHISNTTVRKTKQA